MSARSPGASLVGAAALLAALSLAAPEARAEASSAAVALAVEGRVSVIRHEEEWALFAGDQVEPGETILSGIDGYAQFETADGSSFLVYPDSRVVFRKNPGDWRDLLDLFIGRVKVRIQRFGEEPNPHRVHTPTAVISVRGTTFETAVEDDETTLIHVEEGLVSVRHRLLPSRRATEVGEGQSLVVSPFEPLAKAGVDGAGIARAVDRVARAAASIWRQVGGAGGSGPAGAGGGGGAPLPGDEEAPAPPPPPAR